MTKPLQICLAILLLTATVTVAGLGWYGCYALQSLAQNLDRVGGGMTATLDALNRPCVQGKPCGTLADMDRTLATIRGTVGLIETAARHENKQLTTLDMQERQLFADLHGTMGQAQDALTAIRDTSEVTLGAVGEAQRTIKAADPLLVSLNDTAKASTAALDSLNARITDPRVDALMTHLDATAAHADGATADIQGAIHKVTNPPPCKGRWCWAIVPGKFIWSLRDLPEPLYYMHELIR